MLYPSVGARLAFQQLSFYINIVNIQKLMTNLPFILSGLKSVVLLLLSIFFPFPLYFFAHDLGEGWGWVGKK